MNLRPVDPNTPVIAHRLNNLQAVCLPADVPCEYRPNDLWWIAYDDRVPVGFCCVRPTASDPYTWYLARAGVIPSHRGKGYQARMLSCRVRAASNAGAEVVVTDCTAENAASANSLIRCGFRVYNPVTRWALPSSVYWRKSCSKFASP